MLAQSCSGPVCFPDVKGGWTEGGIIIFVTIVLGIVVFAFVGALLLRYVILPYFRKLVAGVTDTLSSVKEVKEQVQNNHTVNLRDDVDGKHDEIASQLTSVQEGMRALLDASHRHDKRFEGIDQRFTGLDDRLRQMTAREAEFRTEREILQLIDTQTRASIRELVADARKTKPSTRRSS